MAKLDRFDPVFGVENRVYFCTSTTTMQNFIYQMFSCGLSPNSQNCGICFVELYPDSETMIMKGFLSV